LSSAGVPHITPGAWRAASLVGMPIAFAVLSAIASASPGFSAIKIEEPALISIASAGRPASAVSRRSVSILALSESLLKRAHFAGSILPVVTLGAMLTMSGVARDHLKNFLSRAADEDFRMGLLNRLGKVVRLVDMKVTAVKLGSSSVHIALIIQMPSSSRSMRSALDGYG
jgi:hypothetical protein